MTNRRLRALAPAPIALTLAMTFAAQHAAAAGTVSLTALGAPYAQDFDTLASTGTSSDVPNGWDFVESGTNANATYAAGTGSSNAGDTYSFGAAGSGERAFGALLSGSLTPTRGARFRNDTGATITSLAISYTGEEWRLGTAGRADRIDFQISTDATSLADGTWTDHDGLDFTTPSTTATGALDGNAAANRTAVSSTVTGLAIPAGATFWIRWTDFNASGADDGLAVDDLTLTPNGGAGAEPALLIGDASVAEGDAGTSDLVFTVSLTAPAGPGGVAFDVATADGTATTADGDYVATSLSGQTIPAGQTSVGVTVPVNGDTAVEPDETLTATVSSVTGASVADAEATGTILNDDVAVVPIHQIQGPGHLSPLVGRTVRTAPAVVTALRTEGSTRGFYLEDPSPDADPATSEGIFVFTGSSSSPASLVAVGDRVQVDGTVSEYRPGSNGLTITELTSPTVTVLSSGNPLPAATVVGAGGRVPPTTVIDDDASGDVETSGTFDEATDGIDFYESLEGMLVAVHDPVATGPTSDFGSNREVPVIGDEGAGAGPRTPRGGIVISPGDLNPERIILNDWIAGVPDLPPTNVGDRFPGTVTGVVDYSFDNFKLQVVSLPARVDGGLAREVTDPQGADEVSVGTFNVENLAATDPASKFDELAGLIVGNLRAPDILAIEEIQDDNGTTNDADTSADQTWTHLIAAVEAAGGPTYAYRQIDPVDDADGGAPGGNIRQGFLFRTDRGVSFVDRPGATSTTSNAVVGSGSATRLEFSPGRIDPTDGAFADSRKPLAAEFNVEGQPLFVIGNHFNSKGGDQPLFGRFQPPTLSSEVQRLQQAAIVNGFVGDIVGADADADVVVLGDINDFQFSPAMETLEGDELTDLMDTLPESERYTYVYQGNSQALDHTLVSDHLLEEGEPEYDVVHVNSEFADQASDHDPQVTRLPLKPLPALSVEDAEVGEGDAGTRSLVFTVTRSGPSGVPVSVSYATEDETARAGSDYREARGTLSLAPGELTGQIAVAVKGDRAVEDDETLRLVLSSPVGATIAAGEATGTIIDDDGPPSHVRPRITIRDASVLEGDVGTRPMGFTVCLSTTPTRTTSVRLSTLGLTARGGSDFRRQSVRVAWRAGGPKCLVSSVAVIGDRRPEPDERLLYVVSRPVNAVVADRSATGTIRNDDRRPGRR